MLSGARARDRQISRAALQGLHTGNKKVMHDIRPETTIILLYSLIIHSFMNLFFTTLQAVCTFFFPSLSDMRNYFFHSFNMTKPAPFFPTYLVNKQPSTSEVIRRYRSTYEGCALVPLVTSSIGDSELIIHFQKAYARLFPDCYNKHGIQSNLPS